MIVSRPVISSQEANDLALLIASTCCAGGRVDQSARSSFPQNDRAAISVDRPVFRRALLIADR